MRTLLHLSALAFSAFFSVAGSAQFTCHTDVLTCAPLEPACIKSPTSFVPVTLVANTGEGWNAGGACGTKSCLLFGIFPSRCPCGNPLSTSVCGVSAGGGGCRECGAGIPCDTSPEVLNRMLQPVDQDQLAAWSRPSIPPVAPRSAYVPAGGSRVVALRTERALRDLVAFYENLRSVRFRATVWAWRPDRSSEGSFAYAAQGDRAFASASIDPRFGLAPAIETAFDGATYQLFYPEDKRLHLSRRPKGAAPFPFPNPLFLPVGFLGWEDDDCSPCIPTRDSILDPARWQARVGAATGRETKEGPVLELPGGNAGGEAYFFRIEIDGQTSQVRQIELVRPGGRVLTRLELLDYRTPEGSFFAFPWHIVIAGLGESGESLAELHYTVQELGVNIDLPRERFRIAPERALMIIDEDQRIFLKHPQLHVDDVPRQSPNP